MPYTKPSDRYLAELDDVANAANDLYEFLANQPNMLPLGFPNDAVITLCSALSRLPDGSVEGSVSLLDAGREQCPTIRRNYIPPAPNSDENISDVDAPPVYRGGELDTLINQLYVAIGTAIDAYRDEYGKGFLEGIEIDPPVAPEPEFLLDGAIKSTRKAELKILEFSSDYEEELLEEGELQRGLVDTANELKAARSAASMPQPKPKLLSRLANVISRAPEALRLVGRTAIIFADTADPLVKATIKILMSSWESLLDSASIAGEALEESARRLAFHRDQLKEAEIARPTSDSIDNPEFSEDEAIKILLDGRDLPNSWYRRIEKIELPAIRHSRWLNFSNTLLEISKCTRLRYLDLSQAPLDNIEFLKNKKTSRRLGC